jgi:hypothetical protein
MFSSCPVVGRKTKKTITKEIAHGAVLIILGRDRNELRDDSQSLVID